MRILEELAGLLAEKLDTMKSIVAIVQLETRLARLSVYPLILNICMLLIISMGMWLSTMTLLGYFALLAFNNMIGAILSIMMLNVVFFLGLLKYLSFNLKNMSFTKTRAYLLDERDNDEPKKTIAHRNR
jgi:hypothetical protein